MGRKYMDDLHDDMKLARDGVLSAQASYDAARKYPPLGEGWS